MKCSTSSPSRSCKQCRRAGLHCPMDSIISNPETSPCHSSSAAASWTAPSTATHSRLPERREMLRLLDAYFAGPHHFCFYTFVHQPTFMQMLNHGLIPKSLLLVVCATSLRFINPTSQLPDQWADESRSLVMQQIFSLPSMSTLQTLLLLQRYEWLRGGHIGAWFLAGLAIRLTHALQLNMESTDVEATNTALMPITVRETRRRLMWSCFVMESFTEAGRQPLSGLRHSAIDTNLPCDEQSFQDSIQVNMESMRTFFESPEALSFQGKIASSVRGGISAFLVSVTVMRLSVLEYTLPYHPRNHGHVPGQAPWNLEAPFYQYRQRLDDWAKLLPEDLGFNPEHFDQRLSQVTSKLITLHCLFHGCYCDLYRVGSYLSAAESGRDPSRRDGPPPTSFLQHCRRGRLEHAFAIAQIISTSAIHFSGNLDPVISICACLSIRVLTTERRADDGAALGLPDEVVSRTLDPVIRVVRDTALRCEPIWKLFDAIGRQMQLYGYQFNVSDMDPTSSPSRPESRQPSPSLMTYGTFGTIRDSLARSEIFGSSPSGTITETQRDSVQAHSTPIDLFGAASSSAAGFPNTTNAVVGNLDENGQSYDSLQYYGMNLLDQQALQLATGWADGSLDSWGGCSSFEWADQSLTLDSTGLPLFP